MRIAYFHNWSWMGAAIGRALIERKDDELWMIGTPVPAGERDPDLTELAKSARIHFVAPKDVAAGRFIRRLRVFAPDLILVGTFTKKLPPELLAVPKVAAINVHSSLLPAYRGALPEFWVIRNGEERTGITIHLMTERFDAGGILAQTTFDILPDDTLLTLSSRISAAAPPLVLSLLDRYRAGERPAAIGQDESIASKAPFVRDEHVAVHWDDSAVAIDRLVRASFPVFEPHTLFRGYRLVIRRARVADPDVAELAPGEMFVDRALERLLVGTGRGALQVVTVEAGSTMVFGGYAFATALQIKPHEKLGSAG